jgi:hypothetical protein
MNVEADELSRFSDKWDVEDHALGKKWYKKICRWGGISPTMDAFANAQNSKEERYGAMNEDDKCTHVCSVAVHPVDEEVHAFPPHVCVEPFLRQFAERLRQGYKQRVLLVVPSQMDQWTLGQLENRQGCAIGVRKVCRLPREAVELGVVGHPRWANNRNCTFDVYLLDEEFRIVCEEAGGGRKGRQGAR